MIASNSLLSQLIQEYQPGYSLPQPFYTRTEVFKHEGDTYLKNQWHIAGHVSKVTNSGDYFLFKVMGEELIIIRDNDNQLNAFYNVCRHRGSRVCREKEGNKNTLTCPYHAWSYKLDGSLRLARLMKDDFNAGEFGLHRCELAELEGIIFVCLGDEPETNPKEMAKNYTDALQLHGIASAKISSALELPTHANWKLVVENFIECYHCAPAHHEYSAVHSRPKLLAVGAGEGSGPEGSYERFEPELIAWREQAEKLGSPVFDADKHQHVMRAPIKEGSLTESKDGQPVAPLMGSFKTIGYDGGVTAIAFNYCNYLIASNDHAIIFRFTPISEQYSEVEAITLVDGDAVENKDYIADKVSWVWDVTLAQDATITEDNQAGILSRKYQPGPYSTQENAILDFHQDYMSRIK